MLPNFKYFQIIFKDQAFKNSYPQERSGKNEKNLKVKVLVLEKDFSSDTNTDIGLWFRFPIPTWFQSYTIVGSIYLWQKTLHCSNWRFTFVNGIIIQLIIGKEKRLAFFRVKRSIVLLQRSRTLVSVPDTETWFQSYTIIGSTYLWQMTPHFSKRRFTFVNGIIIQLIISKEKRLAFFSCQTFNCFTSTLKDICSSCTLKVII